MRIYIPTYGRAFNQATLSNIPASMKTHCVTLVVQDREKHLYAPHHALGVAVLTLPPEIWTVAPTRDFVIEHHVKTYTNPRLVMVDDDLTFFKRRNDDPTKFLSSTGKDVAQMFKSVEIELGRHAHVGVLAREGANRVTEPRLHNMRMMRVLGYRADILHKEKIKFSDVELMEDFHVALKLLTKGYRMCVLGNYCQNQAGSGKAGGCSHYRTPELHEQAARKLHAMYPGFVKLVEKTTKTAWGGTTRLDVQVAWKKAFEYGVQFNGEHKL